MIEEAQIKGAFDPSSILIWERSTAWFFLGLIMFFGLVGLVEHPFEFGGGFELLEGVWFGFLAIPSVLLLLMRDGEQKLIILNRKSIDVASSHKKRTIEISSMDWRTMMVNVRFGEGISIELQDTKSVLFISGPGPYHNFSHFCAYLLRVAPEGILADPRGRKYIEDNAKAAEGKSPAFP